MISRVKEKFLEYGPVLPQYEYSLIVPPPGDPKKSPKYHINSSGESRSQNKKVADLG